MGQDIIGQVLQDTYRVERMIGEGGMGAVYEASHLRLPHQRFAIKVLSPSVADQPDALIRFRREAEITSAIGHPHILMVLDFNTTPDGAAYIVMELLKGEDLAARIGRRKRLDLPEAASIFRQTASALEAAHQKGVVHRDLKPRNIFLCKRGKSYNFVKIVDFGISKVLGSQSLVTRTRALMGTPCYMSPEQAEERASQIDAQADIYAMGVILFEMLTGRPPFIAQTVPSLLYKIVHEHAPSVRELRPDIPADIDAAVTTALSKEPAQRHPSIAAFWRSIARSLGDEGAEPYEHTEDRSEQWAIGSVPTNATLPLDDDPYLSATTEGAKSPHHTGAPYAPTVAPDAPTALTGAGALQTHTSTLSSSSGESRRRTVSVQGPSRLLTIGVAFAATLAAGVLVLVLSTRSPTPTRRAPVVEDLPRSAVPAAAGAMPAVERARPAPRDAAAAATSRPAADSGPAAAVRTDKPKPKPAATRVAADKPARTAKAKARTDKPARRTKPKLRTDRRVKSQSPTKKQAPPRIGEGIMDF